MKKKKIKKLCEYCKDYLGKEKLRVAKYKCPECDAIYCDECYNFNEGCCGNCHPPDLVDIDE